MRDQELIRVMRIDPLGDVCDAIGVHHSDGALGDLATLASIPLFQAKDEIIRREMTARGDTHRQMTLAEFETILASEGFEPVLVEPVEVHDYSAPADLLVYAHRDGMLVKVCTYGKDRSVGGMQPALLLNWSGDAHEIDFPFSGTLDRQGVTAISFNVDTGLRLILANLRERGEIVSPWVKRPFVYLLSYKEGCDRQGPEAYKALNDQRIAKLPEWVQAFMELLPRNSPETNATGVNENGKLGSK